MDAQENRPFYAYGATIVGWHLQGKLVTALRKIHIFLKIERIEDVVLKLNIVFVTRLFHNRWK